MMGGNRNLNDSAAHYSSFSPRQSPITESFLIDGAAAMALRCSSSRTHIIQWDTLGAIESLVAWSQEDFESQSLTIGRFRRSLPYPTVRLHFDYQVRRTCSLLTELSTVVGTLLRVDEVFNAHPCWIRQSGLLQNSGHQVSVRFKDCGGGCIKDMFLIFMV